MKYQVLEARLRDVQGKGASRRLRHAGEVPGIIYGAGTDPVMVSLDHNKIYYALKAESFHTSILTIRCNNEVEKVLLRDFQMHAFKPQVLHIDFQRVNETEKVHISIPLHFINEDSCEAVKIQGAHVTHVATEVEIRALASDIPHFIEVDLKALKAGQTIHLSDLKLPKGVSLVNLLRGDDSVVVIVGGIAEEVESTDAPVAAGDVPVAGAENKS